MVICMSLDKNGIIFYVELMYQDYNNIDIGLIKTT